MLTFENDPKGEKLEIHTDLAGLEQLKKLLSSLMESAERNGTDNIHLKTREWAGEELSSEKQGEANSLYNHVKIFCWNE